MRPDRRRADGRRRARPRRLRTYIDKLRDAVDFQHFMAGMIKAPFAALIIGLVGCLEGMKVEGSAEIPRQARDQRRGQGDLPGDNSGRRVRHVSVGDRDVIVENGREVCDQRPRARQELRRPSDLGRAQSSTSIAARSSPLSAALARASRCCCASSPGWSKPDAGEVGLFGQQRQDADTAGSRRYREAAGASCSRTARCSPR